jgi:hypothetical protein
MNNGISMASKKFVRDVATSVSLCNPKEFIQEPLQIQITAQKELE